MEGKKLVAVFLMCMVVLTTMSEATEEEYRDCYHTCHKQCSEDGHGYTFCEMKCDTDCSRKDI
ncbi:Major pollen allergen Ole e 6, partial [Capsicum annuum]